MKLKTIIKLGTVLSVLLFCLAVGYYAFMQLDTTARNRSVNLYAFVPSDCVGVLESNNVNAFWEESPSLNYSRELSDFRFSGLFGFLLDGLNEYGSRNAHGLTNQMSRVLVSFHRPFSSRDQVVYFQMSTADEQVLVDMLGEFAPGNFLPKEEDYRGETIRIYPLGDTDFLSLYADAGLVVMSYQKRLLEKVIDAHLDKTSLNDDETFLQVSGKRKSTDSFVLYTQNPPLPFLNAGKGCWCEYDFHLNTDVFYLTGNILASDDVVCMSTDEGGFPEMPLQKEERLFVSADKDSTALYIDQAATSVALGEVALFDECLSNLSREAMFSMVVDMQEVADNPQRFRNYLPPFIVRSASLLRPFIFSMQLSKHDGYFSHICVFTYKH